MAQAALAQSGMIFDAADDEREPFAAYLTDDASQAAAQAVAKQRGWSTSNIRKGGLATARRLLGVAPPARFMIVDVEGVAIEEVETGLTELARLGSSVMVLGTVNDVNYFRRIMRTGARDYLIKPVDADTLGEIFVRLEQPGDGVTPKGRVVGMLGARGGVGVTTIAINTAFIMSERLSRRTALVDMDLYSGNIALALDIEPTRGLREAFDDPERVDETFLQNAMAKFGKSLHVLATEEAFDDTVRLTDDKMLMLADTIRANFDMAIMDLPRHFVMREPALFSRFDDVVIVTELTLQSLRDVNRMMKLMSNRNRQTKLHVIANQVATKPDVTDKEFEAGIEGKLRCVFPQDAKTMTKMTMKGQALASGDAKHKMVTDLHRLCIELAGVPEEAKASGGGFLKRLSRR
jgi:pilus assembly protein CpaE